MNNLYKTLGLEEGASQAEIKAAYNSLSKKLNPANNDNQDFFKEEYKKVQAAYKALYNTSILATEQGGRNKRTEAKPIRKLEDKPPISNPNSAKYKKTVMYLSLVAVVITLGSLLVYQILFAPKTYKTSEVTFNNNLTYLKNDMSLLTGRINDSRNKGVFVNGKAEGLYIEWYENGQLKRERNYVNGKRQGIGRSWDENGKRLRNINW